MTPRPPWSRENTIAVIAITVSVVGILLSLFNPDVRHFLRLDQSDAASRGPIGNNSNQTLQTTSSSTPMATPTLEQIHSNLLWRGIGTNPDSTNSCSITLTLAKPLSIGSTNGHYHCENNNHNFGADSDVTVTLNQDNQVRFISISGGTTAIFTGVLQSNNTEIKGTYTLDGTFGGQWQVNEQ